MNKQKLRKYIISSIFVKQTDKWQYEKDELDLDCEEMFKEWKQQKVTSPYTIYVLEDQAIFVGHIDEGSYVIKYDFEGKRI